MKGCVQDAKYADAIVLELDVVDQHVVSVYDELARVANAAAPPHLRLLD